MRVCIVSVLSVGANFPLGWRPGSETNSPAATIYKEIWSDAWIGNLSTSPEFLLSLLVYFRRPRCRCRASWTVWFTPGGGPISRWPSLGRAPHWWTTNTWPSLKSRWRTANSCTLALSLLHLLLDCTAFSTHAQNELGFQFVFRSFQKYLTLI